MVGLGSLETSRRLLKLLDNPKNFYKTVETSITIDKCSWFSLAVQLSSMVVQSCTFVHSLHLDFFEVEVQTVKTIIPPGLDQCSTDPNEDS